MGTKRLGTLQKKMYEFLEKYPNEWHSYHQDSTTIRTVNSLKRKRLIKTNKFYQMKLKK